MCVQSKKLLVTVIVAGWMVWGAATPCVEASDLKQDFRLWAPVYLNFPITGPVLGYMEVNPRFSDDVSQIDQLLLRPAVGYQLTPAISLWQGYDGNNHHHELCDVYTNRITIRRQGLYRKNDRKSGSSQW